MITAMTSRITEVASIFGTMEDMEELIVEGQETQDQNHYGLGGQPYL